MTNKTNRERRSSSTRKQQQSPTPQTEETLWLRPSPPTGRHYHILDSKIWNCQQQMRRSWWSYPPNMTQSRSGRLWVKIEGRPIKHSKSSLGLMLEETSCCSKWIKSRWIWCRRSRSRRSGKRQHMSKGMPTMMSWSNTKRERWKAQALNTSQPSAGKSHQHQTSESKKKHKTHKSVNFLSSLRYWTQICLSCRSWKRSLRKRMQRNMHKASKSIIQCKSPILMPNPGRKQVSTRGLGHPLTWARQSMPKRVLESIIKPRSSQIEQRTEVQTPKVGQASSLSWRERRILSCPSGASLLCL